MPNPIIGSSDLASDPDQPLESFVASTVGVVACKVAFGVASEVAREYLFPMARGMVNSTIDCLAESFSPGPSRSALTERRYSEEISKNEESEIAVEKNEVAVEDSKRAVERSSSNQKKGSNKKMTVKERREQLKANREQKKEEIQQQDSGSECAKYSYYSEFFVENSHNVVTLDSYRRSGIVRADVLDALGEIEREIGQPLRFLNVKDIEGSMVSISKNKFGILAPGKDLNNIERYSQVLLHEAYHVKIKMLEGYPVGRQSLVSDYDMRLYGVVYLSSLMINLGNRIEHILFGGKMRKKGFSVSTPSYMTLQSIEKIDFNYYDKLSPHGLVDKIDLLLGNVIDNVIELRFPPKGLKKEGVDKILSAISIKIAEFCGSEIQADAIMGLAKGFVDSFAKYTVDKRPSLEEYNRLTLNFINRIHNDIGMVFFSSFKRDPFLSIESIQSDCGLMVVHKVDPRFLAKKELPKKPEKKHVDKARRRHKSRK